ncbi:enoyl-CoA hydratase/isomerase family protein [Parahaliea maris]|uniref:Enoyl-CoA hydratase/isomerase family protein n=1 Tax=Parahaliea maris TaxID=2716870 RepID=A0A5C8ZS64_9GAMM|nr:enoyl-CoA hydratase-related protein [Parahaliea maris]TXS91286.1 enoyl-CoA hydratase/isomerase family protein [Parahaliea maris]
MTDTILYERRGEVGQLTLNVPERHNSLGEEQLLGIRDILSGFVGEEAPRVLVVSGAGDRTFCAGASLKELNSGRISGELFQETTDRIAALPMPTLAAINGNVFGGGVELALSCDFRVGIEGTRLRVPAAAIGLCYPIGGIQRFVERLGVSASKRLLMAAEEQDSDAMRELGFLDYVATREEFASTVQKLADNLAGLAPLAARAMKQLIGQSALGTLDPAEAEVLVARCRESADLVEGFAAQREKRTPRFRGC